MRIDICDLEKMKIILGMPWLVAYNPEINWETREVKMMRCLSLCGRRNQKKEKVKRTVTLGEKKIVRWAINDKKNWGKEKKMEEDHRKIEEMVPKRFLKWKKVFEKDQLRKGYIKPSKSPQMSPVFFVGKKDGSKRIVINYCNLNNQTIKNNYLLLLITELIDNIGSKKVFTKIDLRWGFNNVRIKEGDE